MINPHKGDVQFLVGNQEFTLRFSHLALVKLENLLDKNVVEIIGELQSQPSGGIRIGTIVALLWAGLQKHHPNITYEKAADLLDDMDGGTIKAMEVIGAAFEKAFNAPETKGTNPTLVNGGQPDGIGTASLLTSSVTVMTPSSFGT